MKFLRSTLGFMIAGMIVMSVWDGFVGSYGIVGGYFAAFIIIGPMWFLNHYVGLIDNPDEFAFVDMAVGIGITGIFRDIFLKGASEFIDTIPTLLLVMLGATIAGLVAAAIEKDMEKKAATKFGPADEEPGPGYKDR
ncbi:hypothetical protein LMF32_06875 [Desemzia sp. C1]|uniref:Lin0368 family putative glycerol transporter subunit n=1 Tax=Desemzia sp. C1 TaxID=2892016 RepID=UPI001E4D3B64|nr:hypothetical protein [Desemzia sp. C1]MCI3028819.1 hypothetical protein [Desemzia sp. C1]